jgi:type 1 fimbriae regulatory protein FimB/type 1 fimbriae regulatory protein FimE
LPPPPYALALAPTANPLPHLKIFSNTSSIRKATPYFGAETVFGDGLRASEVCDLQWHQVELDHGRMHVRRAKNGTPSVHPIRGDEIRALRKLRRESPTEASYVFVTEHGGPMSTIGFHHLIQRLGETAKMPFPIHPHMLRHACGFKLANDGHDTRALQHYLGHKNIQHTVRYTEMAPDRFKDFWRG